MHATFHYKSLYGHVVEPDSNPKCEHHLDYLYELFENSATEAVYLIQNFNNALYGDVLSNFVMILAGLFIFNRSA